MGVVGGFLSFPAVLVGGLLIAAAVAYLLRAWERAVALTAAIGVGALTIWLWSIDASAPAAAEAPTGFVFGQLSRFGFAFGLHEGALPAMVFAFALTTVGLLLAARTSQGSSFPPVALALLAGYSAFYLLAEAPIAAPLVLPMSIVLLSCVSAVGLQAGRFTRSGGSLRWLIAPTLALPLFFIARWYIEQTSLNPQDDTPLRIAGGLLSLALLVMMAPTPLHSVQPATAEAAPPVATALFTLLYQLALIVLVSRVLLQYPLMQELSPMSIWFSWAGLVTAIWAGLAALGANHSGRLWGYAALYDWGMIILLLSSPGLRTWSLVALLFILRAASMFTAAAGLMSLEQNLGRLTLERLQGAGTRMPWTCAAFLLGGLGLVGFPLSAGFAGHWAALQLVAASDWLPAAAVLIASGGAIIAFIRQARAMFGAPGDRYIPREGMLGVAIAAAVLLVSFSLAIAPQMLNSAVTRAIIAFGG